jgi:hypothetical protein
MTANHQPKGKTYVYKLTRCQSSVYRIYSYKIDRGGWLSPLVLLLPSIAYRSPFSGSCRHVFLPQIGAL